LLLALTDVKRALKQLFRAAKLMDYFLHSLNILVDDSILAEKADYLVEL
jgi:hypothetical protein